MIWLPLVVAGPALVSVTTGWPPLAVAHPDSNRLSSITFAPLVSGFADSGVAVE